MAQDYPVELLDIIVADGQSTDDSCAIVRAIIGDHPNCRLIDNPDRIQSCGWNLGIQQCSGDVITIVSAHCELAADYVARAVETLIRTRAALVGGPMRASSSGPVGSAIALGTSSPFGVGGARFHYATSEVEVDTVYQGFCWRELYEVLGGFDTEMVRNQDDELSFRIKAAGGRIVCNPGDQRAGITIEQRSERCFVSTSQYGFWKVRLMQKCASQMRVRHFAPRYLRAGPDRAPVAGAVGCATDCGLAALPGPVRCGGNFGRRCAGQGTAGCRHSAGPAGVPDSPSRDMDWDSSRDLWFGPEGASPALRRCCGPARTMCRCCA